MNYISYENKGWIKLLVKIKKDYISCENKGWIIFLVKIKKDYISCENKGWIIFLVKIKKYYISCENKGWIMCMYLSFTVFVLPWFSKSVYWGQAGASNLYCGVQTDIHLFKLAQIHLMSFTTPVTPVRESHKFPIIRKE
jgi:hypothetical protein